MRVAFTVWTRPEIIKKSMIIKEFVKHKHEVTIIKTNQHYDDIMFNNIYKEFELPEYVEIKRDKDNYKNVCNQMMRIFEEKDIELVITQWDTDSTLLWGISAKALNIPLVHILDSHMAAYIAILTPTSRRGLRFG